MIALGARSPTIALPSLRIYPREAEEGGGVVLGVGKRLGGLNTRTLSLKRQPQRKRMRTRRRD